MNAFREQIKTNPLIVGVAIGFIVGTIFGLVVLGWWIWPVEWKDASAKDLVYSEQVEYLRMSIEAFGQNGDAAKAQARYKALGENGQEALNEIVQNPGTLPIDLVLSYSGIVAGAEALTTPVAPGTEATPVVGGTPAPTSGGGSLFSKLWPLLCVLGLVLAAILAYLFLRGRPSSGVVTPAMQAQEAKRQAAWTDYAASGSEPPTAQFMASYKLGDDLFDDSFSIDSASGEFLGECGVGISDTVGVGDPKKVTAFEVWLFDKNDIQTVTKVVMSAHAFNDIPTRQRLEAKGEPVLAAPGAEAVLETQTLQMVARVVNMGYGEGAMPEESFFDSFILELAIWQK
ncbi:MAG: hypothetical protein AB1894_13025 [Chloroflexota bacterium]